MIVKNCHRKVTAQGFTTKLAGQRLVSVQAAPTGSPYPSLFLEWETMLPTDSCHYVMIHMMLFALKPKLRNSLEGSVFSNCFLALDFFFN